MHAWVRQSTRSTPNNCSTASVRGAAHAARWDATALARCCQVAESDSQHGAHLQLWNTCVAHCHRRASAHNTAVVRTTTASDHCQCEEHPAQSRGLHCDTRCQQHTREWCALSYGSLCVRVKARKHAVRKGRQQPLQLSVKRRQETNRQQQRLSTYNTRMTQQPLLTSSSGQQGRL
jgi:hypothetical protein